MSARRRWWIQIGLCAALLASACGQRGGEAPSNVVFVLIDTARADRFSSYGYARPTTPRMDMLASEGAVFLEHYSQGSNTRSAMPSLLYSRYLIKPIFPAHARVPMAHPNELFRTIDSEALSLPEALSLGGLRTVLINTHPWLRPGTDLARQYQEVIHLKRERNQPPDGPRYPFARAATMVDRAVEWIEGHAEERFFLSLHLMDLHEPLIYGEDAEAMHSPGVAKAPDRWERRDPSSHARPVTEAETAWLNAAYDGSLHYVDRQLGRLVDALDGLGVTDKTLIVITSDHGEMLFERGNRRGHGGPMYEAVARVPLILHHPGGVAPQRFESLSESVDVLPTIVGLLKIELPPNKALDGVDLLSGSRPEKPRVVSATSVRSDRFKLILHSPLRPVIAGTRIDQIQGELYDLVEDPGETNDLWAAQPEVVRTHLGDLRRDLGPAFRRYLAATTDVTPSGGFAIAAAHFEVEQLTSVSGRSSWPSGWARAGRPDIASLHGRPEAEPCRVGFRIPNGRYRLSIGARGRFDVEARSGSECGGVGSPPVRMSLQVQDLEPSILGSIEVCDEWFEAEIRPGQGEVSVSYFGFEPWRAEDAAPVEDAERTERLKALGYIN